MNLADTDEDADFRRRLREWLTVSIPADPIPPDLTERHAYLVRWHRKLHEAGWVGLSWPRKYGGQGLGPVSEAIFSEELALSATPAGPLLGYIGRPILQFGTERQKVRYLSRMLASEDLWCQGFSEPDAGSDLASLRTRADDAGDHFEVTGQKVWTSYAQFADYCLLLARTRRDVSDHRGISAMVVDMRSPGISVRPIVQITGDEEFCEVFFDGVVVPKENLIGELHGGWKIALTTLTYERGPVDIGYVAIFQMMLTELRDELVKRGNPSPEVKCRVASAAVRVEALRLKCLRSLTARAGGEVPGPETSVDKLLMAQTEQYLLHTAMEVLGTDVLSRDSVWFNRYQYSRAATIYGGSAQIQRSIVATRILKLPRAD